MRLSVRFALILSLYGVLATVYSFNTPLFEAPDEYYHFAVIEHLARTSNLPPRDAPREFAWRQMTFHAPFYYRVGAVLIASINTDDFLTQYPRNPHAQIGEPNAPDNVNFVAHAGDPLRDTGLAVRVVRLFSVVLGAFTIVGIYLMGRFALPESPEVALVAVCLVVFNPQFLYISGVISNDTFVTAMSSLSLALLVHLIRYGIRWRILLLLAITLALASIAKGSGITLYPAVIFALLWVCWRDRLPLWKVIAYGIVGLSVWGVIAGGWYVDNWRTLGDPTASYAVATATGLRDGSIDLISELRGVYYSFWGLFGWFNILAPQHFYTFIGMVICVGLAGLIFRWKTIRLSRDGMAITLTLMTYMFIFLASWWTFNQWVLAGQGRLWFPLLGVFALILAFGLTAPLVRRVMLFLLGGMAVFALVFPFTLLHPAFASHALESLDVWQPETAMTSVVFREPWQDEACINLWIASQDLWIGEEGLHIPLVWGVHCTVSGYWSVFAHLSGIQDESCIVGDTSHIIAQEDTMPDGGNMPFPALSVGRALPDELVIVLPENTANTDEMRLQIGLYDAGGSFIRAFVDLVGSHFTDGVTSGECAPELVNVAIHAP